SDFVIGIGNRWANRHTGSVERYTEGRTVIQSIVNYTFKIFTFKNQNTDDKEAHISRFDALRGAIEMHHDSGLVIKEDRDMLDGILDLPDIDVGSIMVHRKNMVMFDVTQPQEELMQKILDTHFSRVPLWEGNSDNIVGVLHVKNLLKIIRSNKDLNKDVDIKSLAYEPWFVPENTSLKNQLQAFRSNRSHFAIVVDEYGSIKGLVTLEDVLEEIVGDIIDEHDALNDDIKPTDDNCYMVNGQTTIRDVNRKLGWDLPDGDASTVAGLIIHHSETIPEIGDNFDYYNVNFTIIEKKLNQITLIKIDRHDIADDEDE
ncbi:MAG: transporter associated domain-containing protein, partial [Pseudomonadota bacterium]